MIAKLGVVLIMAVLAEEEVDGTSLLSMRGVMQDRTTPLAKFKYSGEDASKEVWQCPDGSSHITSHQVCLDACTALGAFVGDSPDWVFQQKKAEWRWPNGCYQRFDVSGSAEKKLCLWNVHDQSAPPNPRHKQYNKTKSICRIDPPSDQSIDVIGTTSTRNYAHSNGSFYIKFSGDDIEYSLYTGGNDFRKGQSDTWALSVKAGADLTKPTIYIKDHYDAWIPSSIVIKKAGGIVFNANGLPAIIDGNCKKEGLQWGNLFCAKSITFPFKEVNVEVKTPDKKHANSNSDIYMSFFGDHRQYLLDDKNKNDFERKNTDSFHLLVANAVNLDKTTTLRMDTGRWVDGWLPEKVNVNGNELSPWSDGVAHQFPVWLDGDCPKSGYHYRTPCRNVWDLKLK